IEIDIVGGERMVATISGGNQAIFNEPLGADDERRRGERRKRLIRRMAEARWTQRQHLPPGLARGCKLVNPSACHGSEIADSKARRERRDVEQDSRRSVVRWKGNGERWRGGAHGLITACRDYCRRLLDRMVTLHHKRLLRIGRLQIVR